MFFGWLLNHFKSPIRYLMNRIEANQLTILRPEIFRKPMVSIWVYFLYLSIISRFPIRCGAIKLNNGFVHWNFVQGLHPRLHQEIALPHRHTASFQRRYDVETTSCVCWVYTFLKVSEKACSTESKLLKYFFGAFP